jgi:internalin A
LQPNLAEAERRIEEARKAQAESLDLGDLALDELPASLGELLQLKRLYLGKVGLMEEGESWDWDLTRRSPELTDLSPLSSLHGLQSLNLSSCAGVTDLSPLAGLQGIQSLNLWQTGVADLAPLAGLQGIQSLSLSFCAGVTDLAPLAGLQGIQSLNLRQTSVTDLAPLAGLQGIQSLNLRQTGVTDLAPLAGLQGIQSLKLQYCQGVTDLSPLAGLQELLSLYLYGCGSPVPPDLLRVFVEHPHLTELVADKAAGVPREVLSHKHGDNCLPRLRTYFAEIDLASEAENEVKVVLLGNGRVGKTQLCRRFRGEPFDESVESTHGVQIWREPLRIRTEDQDQVVQVNWWDFGGQDIYHGTHALFLRSRAVFLVLWAPEFENRDEYEENGIPLRNQPLAYWLDFVRTLAGEDSPVIVVQSQCDRFADQCRTPPRPDGLGFFQCGAYSARTGLGRDPLEAQLREAIRCLLDRNGALAIGRGRAEVRRRLYGWRSEDQESTPDQREHRTLTREEFRALCDAVGGIVSWEHALDYLHHTGVVFYRPDLFDNCIILDQTWALDAVYTVFHRGRTAPWLRDSGRFTREDLASLAWQEHPVEEQKLFLRLMTSCGVCFPCGKTSQGEERYIAPDLLPSFEAVRDRLYAWKEEPAMPTLRLEYRFFHPATIRGLMSRIGRQAEDLAEYWKYGFWLKDGKRDTQILVQFEDTSTDEAPGAGALELKTQGRDPLGLLSEIRKSILQRSIGEEPEERLTLGGTTVDRSAIATLIDGRALDIQGKPVSASAFAAFFEDREHHPAEADAKIDIQPQALTPSEKLRELFISYAWGDDTPEGKTRAEVVDALYEALEKDGFKPVRDRNEMRPGDRISAFIRRLTRADLVVAVISDKYLRSSYCMHEIYKLWQKSQTDADGMIERLVPIVLPEVKIEGLAERAPYVRYWKAHLEELRELHRELGEDLDPETLRELRLVRGFAQDVDGILRFLQDVLMPRKLEVHFEDGFRAVREALRRRVEKER